MSRRRLAWALAIVWTGFACVWVLLKPWAAVDPTEANTALTRGQDFRDATYFPVKELLAGGNPYDPAAMFGHWPVGQEFDLYAPLHLVLHLPLAALPYRPSLMAYSAMSVLYLLAIGLISARVLRLPGGWPAAWAAAGVVVFAPFGESAVYVGQINPLVGLGCVMALLFLGRSNGWCALGLALAWTKPQFAGPVTVILLARGAWRPALWGTAGAAAVSLPVVGLLIARAGGIPGFVDVIRANLAYATETSYGAVDSVDGARIDVGALLFRATGLLPPGIEPVVLVVVLGLTAWLLSGRARRGLPLDARELLLASLGVLLCIVHQPNESLITVPGLVAIAALLLRGRRPAWLVLAAAVATAVPLLHFPTVHRGLERAAGPGVAGLAEGVFLLIGFVAAVAASRHRRPVDVRSHL